MKIIATMFSGALLLPGFCATAHAQGGGCDAIKAQIDAKVRATGVDDFVLTVVESDTPAGGRVVGSCDLGTKKIMYERTGAATPPAATTPSRPRPRGQAVITECRDGTVSTGSGDCKP